MIQLKNFNNLLFTAIISLTLFPAMAAKYDPVTQDLEHIDSQFPPAFYEIFIPVDDLKLTGFILRANGKGPHPSVVLMHGLPGNEKNLDLAQSLRRAGFNVLFFHYRGSWGSEGNYSFLSLHKDALAALAFLRKNAETYSVDTQKLSLIGHSFGGYTALRAGSIDKNLNCVVGISAANPGAIAQSKRISKTNESSPFGQYIDQLIMLRNFPGEQAVQELKTHASEMDTRTYGKGLKNKRVLLIVGKQDQTVPKEIQQDVYKHYQKIAGLDVTSQVIAGDHAFSVSRIKMQHHIVKWMQSHCM